MANTQNITNYLRVHNANQFKESVSETANSVYYVFAAKHLPYANGDTSVPTLTQSNDEAFYTPWAEMLFGKRVTPTDVTLMAPRYNWTSNTKYSAFRSDEDLTDKQYFVVVDNGPSYSVFKCLDNNSNGYSISAPDVTQTSANDEFYQTADGYVWKLMYTMDSTDFDKFATSTLMPVSANAAVVGNAVSGAIDAIAVTYRGSHYNTYLSNTFISSDLRVGGDQTKYNIANNATATNNFYVGSYIYIKSGTAVGEGRRIVDYNVVGSTKTITLATAFTTDPDTTSVYEITPHVLVQGDGDGADARALVNTSQSNSIVGIEIVNRGSGYTFANVTITGNTSGVTNAAIATPVLGPKGGHGSNPEYELNARYVGISTSFANNESNTIPVANDYRMTGLLKDPLYANVVLTVGSVSGSFAVGETVTQANTGATGKVIEWDSINTLTLTNVNGIVLTGNTTTNYLTGASSNATSSVTSYEINGKSKNFTTFDQRHRFSFTAISNTFHQDEIVSQGVVTARFHSNTTSDLYLTHLDGNLNTGSQITGTESGAAANLLFHYPPDLVVGSGEVLFTENQSPISRSNTQSETIKLILKF